MNCKPDQLAWIKVPKQFNSRGLEQLNGRIVRTVRLLAGQREPIWMVTPDQVITITAFCTDTNGTVFQPGERSTAEGIPDAFLRPFDPNSEPLNNPAARELERTA
jgi:hypothetical protein